jgi:hypothetical protein
VPLSVTRSEFPYGVNHPRDPDADHERVALGGGRSQLGRDLRRRWPARISEGLYSRALSSLAAVVPCDAALRCDAALPVPGHCGPSSWFGPAARWLRREVRWALIYLIYLEAYSAAQRPVRAVRLAPPPAFEPAQTVPLERELGAIWAHIRHRVYGVG